MEQGSSSKSTTPSLNQPGSLMSPEYNSGMSNYWTATNQNQMGNGPRMILEAEEPQSYLAMLNATLDSDTNSFNMPTQSSVTHQIGQSFSRPHAPVPSIMQTQVGNPNMEAQQTYPVLNNMNMMPQTPVQFSGMGNQNPTYNAVPNYAINIPMGVSNYAEGSSSKSRGNSIYQDNTVPNYPTSFNSFYRGAHGYNNPTYSDNSGFSVYDERYQQMGMPVDPHFRFFNSSPYAKGNAGFM